MTGLAPQFRLATGVHSVDEPIESLDQLVGFLDAGCKDADNLRVGLECERLPLHADGSAAPYAGEHGSVLALLRHLGTTDGVDEVEAEGHLLGLTDGATSVHLEPGAQVELALPPLRTAGESLALLRTWRERLCEAADATGVHAATVGLQPVTPVQAIEWIPKDRYVIMREHLGARGRLAHHMMKATAGVQVNVDYTSERDAAEILRTALSVSPLVNALCVNSPLEEGRDNGHLSKRPLIWQETDPARCGLLPWVMEEGFTFGRYVEWALSVPVMFVVRDGEWHRLGDRTFGDLIEHGADGVGRATHADFQLHLTALFPEVRVKQHVEIRGADACCVDLAAAIAAAWRGLLYDSEARDAACALLADLDGEQRLALHLDVGREALRAHVAGSTVQDLASRLVDVAAAGLDRLAACEDESSEADLLQPLRVVIESGRTPAGNILAEYRDDGAAALLRRV